MSRKLCNISKRERKLLNETLIKLTTQLTTPELTNAFFTNLLTESERMTIARRLLIASMIQRGETYMAIDQKLHVSPNTIANIRKWTKKEFPNYQAVVAHALAVSRKRKQKQTKKRVDYGEPFTLQRLRMQYPAHFLLFNIAEELLKKK